ncbi:acyl-homoserine-lactone synthase [Planktotalea sp.]|uniref:acyl-homoserine-lactone synthase n=1 Tax=Planktotalea sp. TaxID=2029877 RepID=UPI003D6B31FF
MNSIIVNSANLGCYGSLYHEHLKHRHQRFVTEKKWDIPHNANVEQDQYDRHDSVYVLVELNGDLVGYARMLRTDKLVVYGYHTFSYMVRDASLGLLPGIERDLLDGSPAPSDPTIWEMTRFHALDRSVMKEIFRAAAYHIKNNGGTSTISYTRKSYKTILNRIGFPTQIIGPVYTHAEDGMEYCVLRSSLIQ